MLISFYQIIIIMIMIIKCFNLYAYYLIVKQELIKWELTWILMVNLPLSLSLSLSLSIFLYIRIWWFWCVCLIILFIFLFIFLFCFYYFSFSHHINKTYTHIYIHVYTEKVWTEYICVIVIVFVIEQNKLIFKIHHPDTFKILYIYT